MNVETILRDKGDWVATIRPDATIAEAVEMLNRERIGALVVSDDGDEVAGVLSERDIVHRARRATARTCCRARSTRS